MKKYTRHCTTCNKILHYSSYKNLWRANKTGVSCIDCVRKQPRKNKNAKYSRNCPICQKTLMYSSQETLNKAKSKKCISCVQKNKSINRKHSEEAKKKISQNHSKYWLGKSRPMKEESKQKLRTSTINFITKLKGKCVPRYNPTACKLFDEINIKMGWNGRHAENGGEFFIKELGYWVDYYEPNLNMVIEYDERYHDRKVEKDKSRQNEIENFLKCKFVRVKEVDGLENIINKIKEVL